MPEAGGGQARVALTHEELALLLEASDLRRPGAGDGTGI